MLIRRMLEETATHRPDQTALISAEASITYRQLADQVSRLAAGMINLGLAAGDRVAILLPNTIDFVTAMLASNHAGLIAVPLFADYPPLEQHEILADTAARLLITSPDLLPSVPSAALQPLINVILTRGEARGYLTFETLMATGTLDEAEPAGMDRDPIADSIGIIVHTSGSTGRPKGVAHTQSRLARRADLLINTLSLTADDRALTAQHLGRPVFLVADLLAMIKTGGSLTLVDPPETELFWRLYARTSPTYLVAPTGYIDQLIHSAGAAQANHARLRFWINAGDLPTEELQQRVARITGRPLRNMYGLTEGGFLSITTPNAPIKRGSIGKPMAGVEMRLVDKDGREVAPGEVGHLHIRTPNMMVGYWNDTLLTHRAMGSGWLETPDLFRIDEDGDYRFLGRDSEIIVRTGANVASARVIESMLLHPAIAEAVLVGVPDQREGQVPIAFYRLQARASDPGSDRLHAWVAVRVDAWSIPEDFFLLDHWPMTRHGKIDRTTLIAMAAVRTSRNRDVQTP